MFVKVAVIITAISFILMLVMTFRKQALNIRTIRDLAENKFVLIAQAVVALSKSSKK
jgi:hypothetical protein